MPELVTAAHVEAFARDGYVVVENVLSEAELDHFEPIVTAAVARRTSGDGRTLEQRSPYEQSFFQCMNLWEDTPDARALTFHPRVAQAAAELLGMDVLRLWHDQALYKAAGGRETDAHQDQPYWPITETDTITAWIPLSGSTIENGAMGYLPGSHLVGVRQFVNIFAAEDPSVLLDLPEMKRIAPVWVEVPRGAVAFHSGLTVHMAKPNTTGTDRAVHTVIYFADGCTRRNHAFHPSVDRDSIDVGAAIRGACTPIIWPSPVGGYPTPPPPLPEVVYQLATPGTLPERDVDVS